MSGSGTRRSLEWDVSTGPLNYLALLASQGAGSGLALLSAWLATRLLGADGYGAIAALVAVAQMIQGLFNWSAPALFRYGCEEFVESGRVAAAFWTRSMLVGACVAGALVTSPLWLPPASAALRLPADSAPFVLPYVVALALSTHVQYTLQAAKLPRAQGALLALERGLVALALGVATLTQTGSLRLVALAYTAAPLVTSAIGLWRVRGLLWPVGADTALLRRMLAFSLPLLPTALLAYGAIQYLDAFFIMRFLTAADLGRYTIAYLIAGAAMQLPLLASTLLLPLLVTLGSGSRDQHIARYLEHGLPTVTLLYAILCALAAPIGQWSVPLAFGEAFRDAGGLLWPLMAMAALAGPVLMGYYPIAHALSATTIAASNVVAAVAANLVLNAGLIPALGLRGCAWAKVGAAGVGLVVTGWLIGRRCRPAGSWALAATSPVLLGAALDAWGAAAPTALGAALVASALMGVRHRASVRWVTARVASASSLRPGP